MNQPDGFDCPGCAWPDPKHTSSFEFCENGAKAVSFELTKRRVTRGILRRPHRHRTGAAQRLLAGGAGAAHRADALRPGDRPLRADRLGRRLRHDRRAAATRLESPDRAEFYTSGRASNEAAFLYPDFRPPLRHQQFPRLLQHVPRGDQRRPAREHRHRQGDGAAGGFRRRPTRSSSSARIPAPTARG